MNNKALLTEIEKQIKMLDAHFTRLKSKPEGVHEIDIDVMADKLKALYGMVLELETESSVQEITDDQPALKTAPLPDPEPVPEPIMEAEPEPGPEPLPDPEPEPQDQQLPKAEMAMPIQAEGEPETATEIDPITEQLPEPIPEPKMDPEPEAVADPEPDIEPEPITEIPRGIKPLKDDQEEKEMPRPKTTADLFTGATTIAESFQAKEDRSIAARVVPQAVDDLKRAIGINDKFLFINELFKGNPGDYNEAIEKLNTSGAIDAAEKAINHYRIHYEWGEQSEAYHRLKKIVMAKFNGS
ncbi:MAG TPA: hypothetical protein VK994_05590 [Bacteroidales bacterium]|nr:hypothetical protein [Bacteroidales bacterium]